MTTAEAAPAAPAPFPREEVVPLTMDSDDDLDKDSLHESRRSVAKEKWKDFLEAFVEVEAIEAEEKAIKQGHDNLSTTDACSLETNSLLGRRIDPRISTATQGTVGKQLDELNQDLEHTADNLADLEIEFEAEMQMLSVGLESAFDQWNGSDHDGLTAVSLLGYGSHMPLTDDSEFGTSIRSGDGIGTSIRSVRQHTRRLEHIKRDMEDTFRQTLKKQESIRRRSSVAPGQLAVEVQDEKEIEGEELEGGVEAKFQSWFSRVWGAIEDLLAKRQAQREQKIQQQTEKRRSSADPSKVKSFWRLFMEPTLSD